MLKKKKAYWLFILIVLAGGWYYWHAKSSGSSSSVRYVTSVAEKGTLDVSVSGSGNIVVDDSANIDPTITGTVRNLSVNVGDKVKKGQTLFTIENDDLSVSVQSSQASFVRAQASLESAKASEKQAKQDYDDVKDENVALIRKQVAEKNLDAAKESVASAQASLVSAQADLANAQKNAGERTVTSPIDGTVNEINVENGDDLSKLSSGSSRTVPMIIGDLSTMKAEIDINEVDIADLNVGKEVTMTFDAISDLSATGKIEKIDSLGTSTSNVVTYGVTVGLDEIDSRIKPGMSVSANIITQSKENVIMVLSGAIKTEGDKSYVEVLGNDNAVSDKYIETGISNDVYTEVTSGISEGDKIVTQTLSSSTSSSSSSSSKSSGSGSTRQGFRMMGM